MHRAVMVQLHMEIGTLRGAAWLFVRCVGLPRWLPGTDGYAVHPMLDQQRYGSTWPTRDVTLRYCCWWSDAKHIFTQRLCHAQRRFEQRGIGECVWLAIVRESVQQQVATLECSPPGVRACVRVRCTQETPNCTGIVKVVIAFFCRTWTYGWHLSTDGDGKTFAHSLCGMNNSINFAVANVSGRSRNRTKTRVER